MQLTETTPITSETLASTISEIEQAILAFLSTTKERKSKDEIAGAIRICDICAVVIALKNLRAQGKLRTFNRQVSTAFCAEYELAEDVLNHSLAPHPCAIVTSPGDQDDRLEAEKTAPESIPTITSVDRQVQSMKLFADLDPSAVDSIDQAFARIKEQLNSLSVPRSLCQLDLVMADYQWLERWSAGVSPESLLKYLHQETWRRPPELQGFTRREAMGALLLLLAAESARRESREGSVWPTFLSKFSDTARDAITFHGEVSSAVRQSVEAAAQALRLRNVFGRTGIQYYYVSIFLQFGFTFSGLRQLPLWLSGRPLPETMRYLMEEDSSATYSQSFAQMWKSLLDFRRHRLTEEQMQEQLQLSSWILPEWQEDVLRLARADSIQEDWQDDEHDQPLTEPLLVWNWPQDPHFQLELGPIFPPVLEEREYSLRIESLKEIKVSNLNDCLRATEAVRVPVSMPEVTVTLTDLLGTQVHRSEHELWDASEEIILFDLGTGRRLDPFKDYLATDRSYAVITSADLLPSKPIESWMRLSKLQKICWYVRAGWQEFSFNWPDGDPCWQPNLKSGEQAALPFPVRQIGVHCEPRHVQLGDFVRIRLTVPQSVRLKSARIAGLKCPLPAETGTINLNDLIVSAEFAASGFKIRMLAEHAGKRYRISKEVPLSTTGSVRWNGCSWEPVSPTLPIEADDALVHAYKLLLPRSISENRSDYGIFQGDTFCGNLKHKRQPLGTLSGYGAPVVVHKLFNQTAEHESVEVCASVRDSGIVKSAGYIDNLTMQIQLKADIDLAARHCVVIWAQSGEPVIVPADNIKQVDRRTWQLIFPAQGAVSVAVSYDGARIGAQWPQELAPFLSAASQCIQPHKIAAYLRWMGFPILAKEHLAAVKEFAICYAEEVLAAWLSDDGPQPSLTYHENWSEWLSAVRKVFRDWCPLATNSVKLIDSLKGSEAGADKLTSAALKLVACDPLLAYCVIDQWHRQNQSDRQVHQCLNAIMHLTEEATGNDRLHWQKDCLIMAAQTLNVDSRFLENTARTVLEEMKESGQVSEKTRVNLESLLSASSFRDYLACFLLFTITSNRVNLDLCPTESTDETAKEGVDAGEGDDAELMRKYVVKDEIGRLLVYFCGDNYGAAGKTLRSTFWEQDRTVEFIRKLGGEVREPQVTIRNDAVKHKNSAFRRQSNNVI